MNQSGKTSAAKYKQEFIKTHLCKRSNPFLPTKLNLPEIPKKKIKKTPDFKVAVKKENLRQITKENIQEKKPLVKKQEVKTLVLEESSDFKLESLIGEGSFSKVYNLKHLRTGKTYALKAFKLKKYEKFSLNEAEILTKVKHPNIIKIKRLCTYKNRVSL